MDSCRTHSASHKIKPARLPPSLLIYHVLLLVLLPEITTISMSAPQPTEKNLAGGDEVAAALHFGDSAIQRAAIANPEFVNLSFEAKAATDNERSMTLLQGIKLYPKAVGWSMLLSTCIVMEGYDLVLLGRFVLFLYRQRYSFAGN